MPRNTVTSASRTGRLGSTWFDYGVAITASPGSFSTAVVPPAQSGLLNCMMHRSLQEPLQREIF